ncbi:MAG TPA: hypothetical protein VM262_18770 [Acidimicrobiales bacterium]|nr:hypothetical protein [Acidimicrobiales bacterium]
MHKLRRGRRTLIALATIITAAGLGGVQGTSAQTVVPGTVDLTVSIVSKPALVTAGEAVLYEVTVGQGLVPTAGTLTVTVPPGFAIIGALSDCGADGASQATCAVPAAPAVFEVAATAPATTGTGTATATVAATNDPFDLEYTPNNTSTAQTTVLNNSDQVAGGLVEGGDSIELNLADGRRYRLAVPAAYAGVIVTITAESGAGRTCSGGACGDGFGVVFDQSNPTYLAEDPLNPLVANFTFGALDPCRGLGNNCTGLTYAKDVNATVLVDMPRCPGSEGGTAGDGTAIPDPCLNRKYKVSGTVWFDVRLTSDDPIKLPLANIGG